MPRKQRRIRVLVADENVLFTETLALALRVDDRLQVISHAVNGVEAAAFAEALQPDVVVIDADLPILGGVIATQRIRAASPRTRVVVLARTYSRTGLEAAVEAGASRYLTQAVSALDLIEILVELATREEWPRLELCPPAEHLPTGSAA